MVTFEKYAKPDHKTNVTPNRTSNAFPMLNVSSLQNNGSNHKHAHVAIFSSRCGMLKRLSNHVWGTAETRPRSNNVNDFKASMHAQTAYPCSCCNLISNADSGKCRAQKQTRDLKPPEIRIPNRQESPTPAAHGIRTSGGPNSGGKYVGLASNRPPPKTIWTHMPIVVKNTTVCRTRFPVLKSQLPRWRHDICTWKDRINVSSSYRSAFVRRAISIKYGSRIIRSGYSSDKSLAERELSEYQSV